MDKQRQEAGATGLHHITAFAADAGTNAKFYTEVLGQRLIKKTVNFDDPGTYHLYYGDRTGQPGTVLTFFPIPGLARGRTGSGSITHTAYSIPPGSAAYWEERLKDHKISVIHGEHFGGNVLGFTDPEGLQLELVETERALETEDWEGNPISWDKSIRGFHSATGLVREFEGTERLLTGKLGFRLISEEGSRRRYEAGAGGPGTYLDLVRDGQAPPVRQGAGINHHIAFSTKDDDTQASIRNRLSSGGHSVSGVRDRQYFHSIYFHEPNGILFEIATHGPGFLIDESVKELGGGLKLPPQYEVHREKIEEILPSLQ